MSIKNQVKAIESQIFSTKLGGVDQRILDQFLAIHERLNILKAGFDDRKRDLWRQVFGEIPRQIEYAECYETAREITEQHGTFENYIQASKVEDKIDPERLELLKQIFRD